MKNGRFSDCTGNDHFYYSIEQKLVWCTPDLHKKYNHKSSRKRKTLLSPLQHTKKELIPTVNFYSREFNDSNCVIKFLFLIMQVF